MSDDHDHHPLPRTPVEERVEALEAVLIEKGVLDPTALDAIVEYYEHDVGPMNGARVVAHAWVDGGYRQRLLTDGTAAIAELGFGGNEGEHMVVVENTPDVHNVVVCTLCSCYPWPVLGLPPNWYKSTPYRSRMVREPRVLLAEMGCALPHDVEIRVWDSSAEVRYLVLPERPDGSNDLGEEQLAALVTRDSMIRVAPAVTKTPAVAAGLADPSIPRSNGAPVFDAPWQGRALAIAILLVERTGRTWDNFRAHLMETINAEPDRPYWDSFAAALIAFAADAGFEVPVG